MINIIDKSEAQEIEPNKNLVKYFNEMRNFNSKLSDNFIDTQEFHNIISDIDQNIFLLKRLNERNLLKESNNVIDCGIGLGFALYDIYLQSKEINKPFSFTGIEKQKIYIDFINSNLIDFWDNNLTLISGDIMEWSYVNYNIIYTYTPFRSKSKLEEFYNKISSEVKSGSIIIENAISGLGHFDILRKIEVLETISIDDIYIFRKK